MSFGPQAGSQADRTPAPESCDLAVAARFAHEFFLDGLMEGRQLADMEIAAGLLGQNNEVRARMAADQELAAYGPGGRDRFGDPRPGDFPGRGTAAEPEQEAEAG
jgi:hypothetical protein